MATRTISNKGRKTASKPNTSNGALKSKVRQEHLVQSIPKYEIPTNTLLSIFFIIMIGFMSIMFSYLKSDVDNLRDDMDRLENRIDRLENKIDNRIDKLEDKIDKLYEVLLKRK